MNISYESLMQSNLCLASQVSALMTALEQANRRAETLQTAVDRLNRELYNQANCRG